MTAELRAGPLEPDEDEDETGPLGPECAKVRTYSSAALVQQDKSQDLYGRLLNGEPAAVTQLYEFCNTQGRYFMVRLTGAEEIDDRVHEVFVIAERVIARHRVRQPRFFLSYLYQIMRREGIKRIRGFDKQRRTLQFEEVPDEYLHSRMPNSETACIQAQASANLWRWVGLVSSDLRRDVLRRFYILEQPHAKIESELHLTDTQFRLAKSRGIKDVRKIAQKEIRLDAISQAAMHDAWLRTAQSEHSVA